MVKILIVEDEPNIRLLTAEILKDIDKPKTQIFTAENGKIGLEAIKTENPDIVFLDIMMPEMDGYEVARIAKKELNLKNVYIILFTAKGSGLSTDKQKIKDSGADEFMVKPFDPELIILKALEIIDKRNLS
jgi:CheY-like chemotaxis protein